MKVKWIAVLVAVLAFGLIGAGCGDDEDTASTAADTTATEATSTEPSTTEDSTTSSDTGGESSPDDVYNACLDVIEGTPAEAAGQTACEQARAAFEQCTKQAEATPEGDARDLAIQACQDAADQATQALQASG